jgi:hypothetical protein
MRIIKVAYRASFEFPKAETPLNPSGWKCLGEIILEVFESKTNTWKVRDRNGKEVVHWAWQAPSPESLKEIVRDSFERQVSPWVITGNAGDGKGVRVLEPDEIQVKQGKVYVYEDAKEREAAKK